MRGLDVRSGQLFSYVDLEQRVPTRHPLRAVRTIVNEALAALDGRRSAIDRRTTRHRGYAISLRIRRRIEEVFGWSKSAAGQAKTRFRGLSRVRFAFTLTAAAYNLIQLPKLLEAG